MRLNNREEPLTPICATENIPLFVMYLKNELPSEHKAKLDKHLRDCDDCKVNFLYVEEILKDRHPISMDEKTLLLKYLTDPLFYYFANNVRKKVLEDVKELLQEAKIEVKKMASSDIDTTTSKPTKPLTKLHQVSYPYFVLTVSIILFFSLGISLVLVLSSKYPQLQSYLPFSNSASPVVEEKLPSNLDFTLPTMSLPKTAENNRYQQLDTAIDQYLESKDISYLKEAEKIANSLKTKYQDHYGVDLVTYYRSVPSLTISKLLIYRKEMFSLINASAGEQYQKLQQLLENSKTLEKNLTELGNIIEAYRVKAFISQLAVFLFDYNVSQLTTQDGIKFATKNKYLFLEGYFSLWQAKRLTTIGSFNETQKAFEKVILIGQKIELSDLIISSQLSLSTIYHLSNNDKQSLEIAANLLSQPEKLKKDRIITLLQIAGLASFNLKYYQLSDSYLQESLSLAQELNNPSHVARTYTFLSLISAEAGNFQESDNYHLKALDTVEGLKDKSNRLTTLIAISGYYAKAKLKQEDFSQAAIAYKESLEAIKELGQENNLMISQLNEGLALALKGMKNNLEAQQYMAKANHHRKLAENNKQKTNCLLSFVPKTCY